MSKSRSHSMLVSNRIMLVAIFILVGFYGIVSSLMQQ